MISDDERLTKTHSDDITNLTCSTTYPPTNITNITISAESKTTKDTDNNPDLILSNPFDKRNLSTSSETEKKKSTTTDNQKASSNSREREDSIFILAKKQLNSPSQSGNDQSIPHLNYFPGAKLDTNLGNLIRILIENGNNHKKCGNAQFKKNKLKEASVEYLKAIEEYNKIIINSKAAEIVNMTNINCSRMECYNNLAWCHLILKEYEEVINYTSHVSFIIFITFIIFIIHI